LAAAELTESLSAELAARLRTVQYPPVATSAMLYDRAAVEHPLDGFGMLIPGSERRTILGAIFSSTLFPGRAPDGTVLLTAFVGGTRSPERALAAIPDLEFEVHAELRRTLGIGARPIEATTTVWPAAIPQYTLGYDRVLGAIAQAEAAHAGLHLIGNYRGGISVGDCVTNATALAEQLVAEFNGVRPVMPAPGEIPAGEHDGGHGAAAEIQPEIQPDDTTGLLPDVEHATEIRQ
jgi:oxygen-dependent protoporphyrinogen oxidase